MQASVKIMDIDVDMMSNDVFVRKMNEYLTDDHVCFHEDAEQGDGG